MQRPLGGPPGGHLSCPAAQQRLPHPGEAISGLQMIPPSAVQATLMRHRLGKPQERGEPTTRGWPQACARPSRSDSKTTPPSDSLQPSQLQAKSGKGVGTSDSKDWTTVTAAP